MDSVRDYLRAHLGRSLGALPELDRLAAAWPLVCGSAMAAHGRVASFEDGTLWVEVVDPGWQRQMMSMEGQLAGQLSRVAGVPVRAIHFDRSRRVEGDGFGGGGNAR